MKQFVKDILERHFEGRSEEIYNKSLLINFLDKKMGAIEGNSKSRRSFATIYAIYSLTYHYSLEFFDKKEEYKKFTGYEFTKLFEFCRALYGGKKIQNHALNSRVNGEFKNKYSSESKQLIIINNGKYLLHIDFLYIDGVDISKIINEIVEKYIQIIYEKDSTLANEIKILLNLENANQKKEKIKQLLTENSEARIFEILSYAILKNHYKNQHIFIGYSQESIEKKALELYKTGRTNANDGGIDFVMRPLGRFFQVSEVGNYNKYLLDIDKVLHFPITFVIKTSKAKSKVEEEFNAYIDITSGGMEVIKNRYKNAVEEIITINELYSWLELIDDDSINDILKDINLYYKLEMGID